MSFGEQLRKRREELGMTRPELAERLGITKSAVGNYETGVSAPKEEVLLRLFDALQVDPNYLYRDSFRFSDTTVLSEEEQRLVSQYRNLSLTGRQTVRMLMTALGAYQKELEGQLPANEPRVIPLYCSPAAAGFAAPVFGEDYEPLTVTGEVPMGAELAVRIQGDSMAPYIADGSVVYVNHDPLKNGDVGIFYADNGMVCKQFVRDSEGNVYLLSLNRERADADLSFPASSAQSFCCYGKVLLKQRIPLP